MTTRSTIQRAITHVTALLLLTFGLIATASEKHRAVTDEEQPQAQSATHRVYFTLSDEHGFPLKEPRENFDCEDKIYAVVELTQFKLGKHALSIVWTDPSQTDRERTEYVFFVRDEEPTRLWSWLSLSRARGAGMLQWINPAAGLEEFIGPWTVTIKVDGKQLERSEFEVSC